MVSVGDEGFFNRAGNSEWEYGGGEGVRQLTKLRSVANNKYRHN